MARLDQICSLNMGQSPDSSSYNENGEGIPFFQGNADFGKVHPKVRVWCNAPTKIAHRGDVLISVRAPIGALNIADQECCIGRGLAALTVNETVCDKTYLWYAIASKIDELNAKGTGSTFKAISKNVLQETEIPLPEIVRQRQIASKLGQVDELIALRKEQLAKLDELVKARFVEMFGDPVRNTMEWPCQSLNNLCDGIGDGLHGTPEYDSSGDYPFINGNNLIDGRIVVTALTKMVSESVYSKHFIDIGKNAILISINGTLGKLALYNGEQVMLGKSACYCNLKDSLNRVFVFGVMSSDAFAEFLENSATKSTIKNVGLKAIREYRLILPPVELQNQFADFVEQTNKTKLTIQASLDKLEIMKKALMQEYFG